MKHKSNFEKLQDAIRNGNFRTNCGGNTVVYHNNNSIEIVLYWTTIAVIEGRTITLNAGDQFTATTKNRINEVLQIVGAGCEVRQKNHNWYIGNREFTNNMYIQF